MRIIQSIQYLVNDGDIYYEVGKQGTTEIREAEKNGSMAKIVYYKIYKNDIHYADLHQFTEVTYKDI